ncbi:trypsin-like serine protease [Streptomyces sp. NPDC006512]|uniref:trypsin-like serine protease n=1 Tax=Streptomyces sp. NPDC006512 TaxID=3154307 RepID=UPI0033A6AE46
MLVPRPRPARTAGLLSAAVITAALLPAAPALAVAGPEAPAGQYNSVVKLNIGDEANARACTATLVEANWIVTAASCFAGTPGTAVPAGKPAFKSIATLSDGRAVEVVDLVPRTDRDLVLGRLAGAATGLPAVTITPTVPAAGTDLTSAGFGRTKTEWVPGKLHTGTFTTNSSTATTLAVTGKGADVLCKGDTGGPLLNAAGELVGVNSRSWQGGCLGTDAAETRTGAISARVDDIGQWIRETALYSTVENDLNGDGRSDAAMVYHHDNSTIGFHTALAKTDGGFDEFTVGYTVPANSWDRNAMKLITGDFNGDHRTDMGMMYRFSDGSIKMYTGLANSSGHIQPFTSSYTVPAGAGWNWNAIELHAGDFNGDGRSDAAMVYHHDNSTIGFYTALAKTDGGLDEFTVGYTVPANSWDRNAMKLITGDFNGDHRADMGMMYRFSDGSIKMYTGLANASGHIQPFTSSYTVPASAGWNWNAIELHAGDFNGDGRSDAAMVYHHDNSTIGFHTALAKADGGFDEFTVGYTVPANSWDRNAMKLITGDFNGDHRTDMGMMYRFSDGSIKMYTGLANASGHIQPFTSSYTVPASAGWNWNAIDLH